jgi:enolase
VIIEAIEKAGHTGKIKLALDCAASEFFKDNKYVLEGEGKTLDHKQLVDLYASRVEKYPIISIEDGMAEDDFDGWKEITARLKDKIMLVGDDLFVTNMERLQMGIDQMMANAILIKLNQI